MPGGGLLAGAAGGAASGSVAGPIGAIGGALIGAAGSYFSSKQASDFAETAYKHRYQWQVKDLQKAGLNPMLAVQNSPGSVAQPNFENIGEGALKGASAASAVRLTQLQAKNVEAATRQTEAQTNKTITEAQAQEMQNLILQSSEPYQSAKKTLGEHGEVTGTSAAGAARWAADLDVTRAQAESIKENTALTRLQKDLAEGEKTLQQVRIDNADELAVVELAYRRAMKDAAAAGVPAAVADSEFWSTAGPWGKWAAFLKSIFK